MKATKENIRYIYDCAVERTILKKRLAELTNEKLAEHTGLSKAHVARIANAQAHKKQLKALRG